MIANCILFAFLPWRSVVSIFLIAFQSPRFAFFCVLHRNNFNRCRAFVCHSYPIYLLFNHFLLHIPDSPYTFCISHPRSWIRQKYWAIALIILSQYELDGKKCISSYLDGIRLKNAAYTFKHIDHPPAYW